MLENGLENVLKKAKKALPWPVGRYRRILPALTTTQNAGFVTVPSENKMNDFYYNLWKLLIEKYSSREAIF